MKNQNRVVLGVVNKTRTMLNLFQHLPLSSQIKENTLLITTGKRETLKPVQSVPLFIMAKAFTLIELLVVVLIIGILVAIAVPQYQVAVQKSRLTQHIISGNAMLQAVQSYRLANASWPSSKNELEIATGDICSFWINQEGTADEHFVISCGWDPGYRIVWQTRSARTVRYCQASSNNKTRLQVCKNVSGLASHSGTISGENTDLWLFALP